MPVDDVLPRCLVQLNVSLLLCVKPQMDGESKLQATYKKSKTNGISVSKVSGSTKTSN